MAEPKRLRPSQSTQPEGTGQENILEGSNEASQDVPEASLGDLQVNSLGSAQLVTVTVPRAFILRMPDHSELHVKAGVQEMDYELATHWYSVANGVEIYSPSSDPE